MQHDFHPKCGASKLFRSWGSSLLASALLAAGSLPINSQSALAADLDQAGFNKMMDTYLTDQGNVGKVGDALEAYFRNKRDQQRQQAEQAEEGRMEDQFKNPVKIDITGSPSRGPENAKVTIVEFSDFQCPFCSRGTQRMEDVLKEYPKDVKVVFKHLPLSFHQMAKPAARAAVAAQKQGKFWEMHDLLFQNQDALGDELFTKLATQLGLDLEKFKTDYDDPETAKKVEADAALANKLGVQGTPGFFVNGVEVRGARELPYFKKLVDRWLTGKSS